MIGIRANTLAASLLLALLGATALPAPTADAAPAEFRGVRIQHLVRETPRPLSIHVVTVDLTAEGVSVEVGLGASRGRDRYASTLVRDLAREKGYAVAVNGGPYNSATVFRDQPVAPDGPVVHEGITRVRSRDRRHALVILSGGRAAIRPSPLGGFGIVEALPGFDSPVVLAKGRPAPSGGSLHPRTAAGVSRDGRTLILLVVDGRQDGVSEGVTQQELGELLREFGAHDGLNLDGGGGTTLVVADAGGIPRVRNVPVGLGLPGSERPVGTCLGVFAARISTSEPVPPGEGEDEVPDPEPEVVSLRAVVPPPEHPVEPDPDPMEWKVPAPSPADAAAPRPISRPAPEESPRGLATWGLLAVAGILVLVLLLVGRRPGG